MESQLTNLGLQINKTPMEEYNYKLGSQVIKRRWKKASTCHNWAVGSASLQIERASSAKLRDQKVHLQRTNSVWPDTALNPEELTHVICELADLCSQLCMIYRKRPFSGSVLDRLLCLLHCQ